MSHQEASTDIQNILALVEFDACSRRALKLAFQLADACKARLHVVHTAGGLHVAEAAAHLPSPAALGAPVPPTAAIPHTAPTDRSELHERLAAFVEQTAEPHHVETSTALRFEPIAQLLADEGDEFDLIVMGTHVRSWLERLFLGSHAQRAVAISTRPILIVPDDGGGGATPAPT